VQDMFRRIVVGDDGSDHAHHAFEVALEMAERFGAELHVAAVAQVPDYAASVDEVEESVRQATAYYEEVFARVREAAAHREVRLQTHLLKGHAAQSLIHLADELGADLVVVGSRGLSAFQRYLLGSVSEAVMHHAHCPVLVVKRR
jgi:nucleotide-binding universal stress UspA family protein